MEWEAVIGLEVHTQLATQSKIFSGAATAYGAAPNTQACAIDLAMPGVLPVINKEVVNMAIKFGLAIGATVNTHSVFSRKHYFYADSPKGYQISQYDLPIVGEGALDIILKDGRVKTIGVTRAHLEEDAGKLLHDSFPGESGVDFNRTGTPLLEIVSEPDMRTAEEAVAYLKTLHTLVRYIGISDGNMQEGSFRCDVNVSVRPKGQSQLGTRSECKNLNSFRFVEKAIHVEIERQIARIESGQQVVQETRLYDAEKNETRPLRSKEDAHDYRYFPEPDLLPLTISPAQRDAVADTLPELPQQKRERFQQEYDLSAYDASVLVASRALADYFEAVVTLTKQAKLTANWITGELLAALKRDNRHINDSPVSAAAFAALLARIADNTVSGRIAKDVFAAMWQGEGSADDIIAAKGLTQISDSGAIDALIDQILADNPTQLAQYREGKTKLYGFFVGQVMKQTGGKANPAEVNKRLKAKLSA